MGKWGWGDVAIMVILCASACGGDEQSVSDAGTSYDAAPFGDAGAPDGAVAQCACLPTDKCTASGCVTMITALAQLALDNGTLCRFAADGFGETIVAEEGGCIATVAETHVYEAIDLGSVEIYNGDVLVASAAASDPQCTPMVVNGEAPLYGPMDSLTLSVGGSDTVDAIDVVAPGSVAEVAEPTGPASTTVDQALPIGWTPSGEENIDLRLTGSGRIVRCPDVPNTGSFTVPASMTAHLGAGTAQVYVNDVVRRSKTQASPEIQIILQTTSNTPAVNIEILE